MCLTPTQNIFEPKNSGTEIISGQKNFLIKEFFGSKNFLCPKVFRTQKYFGAQKFFHTKIILAPKNFQGPKFLVQQMFLEPKKKFRMRNNFWNQKILAYIFSTPTKCLGSQKIVSPPFLLVQISLNLA